MRSRQSPGEVGMLPQSIIAQACRRDRLFSTGVRDIAFEIMNYEDSIHM